MSASAVKSPLSIAYEEIKTSIHDANRQIRNCNLKTIAKIIAIVAIFFSGGLFTSLACIKMGVAPEFLGWFILPFLAFGIITIFEFVNRNQIKMNSIIKNVNENLTNKLKSYDPCIKHAVSITNLPNIHSLTLPKVELDSYERVNKRYQDDFRRHLSGVLQFSRHDIRAVSTAVENGLIKMGKLTIFCAAILFSSAIITTAPKHRA